MKRVGIIGFGAIGRSIAARWNSRTLPDASLVAILTRSAPSSDVSAQIPRGTVLTNDIDHFLGLNLDLVIEAAGQESILLYGTKIAEKGADFWILSVGALADDKMRELLLSAGARIFLPSGALGGFDALRCLREEGLASVAYTSTKPPRAWFNTEAESQVDLKSLTKRTVLFEGTAREAALRFPKNANLAAAVALAGLGFDRTTVRLIADPEAEGNTGRLDAFGKNTKLTLTMSGNGFADNPKSSEITGLSVLSALENAGAAIRFV